MIFVLVCRRHKVHFTSFVSCSLLVGDGPVIVVVRTDAALLQLLERGEYLAPQTNVVKKYLLLPECIEQK